MNWRGVWVGLFAVVGLACSGGRTDCPDCKANDSDGGDPDGIPEALGCPVPSIPLGTHTVPERMYMSAAPQGLGASLAIADLDGNGVLDVIAARGAPHTPGSLEIHYEPGGQLVVIKGTDEPFYGGLAVGDIDGDGCLDLAVAYEKTRKTMWGGVDVFLGHWGDEQCEVLGDDRRHRISFTGTMHGARVALGDFDHDGRLDLAATQVAKNYLSPKPQLLCFNNSEPGQVTLKCRELETELGGALAVDFADIDADGHADLVFGGVHARRNVGEDVVTDVWALILRGDGTRIPVQELVIRHGCPDCLSGEIPSLVDLEIIPRGAQRPRIAAVFSNHLFPSMELCTERSYAAVFEVDTVDVKGGEATVNEVWTSSEACHGSLSSLEAVSIGPTPSATPALLIGVLPAVSAKRGHLLTVSGWGAGPGGEQTWRSVVGAASYYSYASVAADLDGSDTGPGRVLEIPGGRPRGVAQLIPLDRPLHWIPTVRCDDQPVGFAYAIESTFLTLAEVCDGSLQVEVREDAAQDILYIPAADGQSGHPIQILKHN